MVVQSDRQRKAMMAKIRQADYLRDDALHDMKIVSKCLDSAKQEVGRDIERFEKGFEPSAAGTALEINEKVTYIPVRAQLSTVLKSAIRADFEKAKAAEYVAKAFGQKRD